ncbi:unnamed protein product [Caenorhabditis nigoni]
MLPSILLALILPVSIFAQCGTGAIYNQDRNKCFQYYTASMDFKSAETVCDTTNGHLVSVHSLIDNTFLAQQAQKNLYNGLVWLGAEATSEVVTNPNNWKWTDNTAFNYQNYQSGQPSVLGSTACMIFSASTGKWLTSSCINSYPFICAYDPINVVPTTTCPPQKPNNCPSRYAWLEETNSCYKTIVRQANFTEANAACQYEGAQLASVHSKLENDFLVEISTTHLVNETSPTLKTHVYIGLVYLDGAWKWTDGSPKDYLNWAAGEPNNMNREFWTVLMPDVNTEEYNPTGTEWNNIENNEQRAFICKRAAS